MVGRQPPPWLRLSLAGDQVMICTTEEEVKLPWEALVNGVGKRLPSTNTESD